MKTQLTPETTGLNLLPYQAAFAANKSRFKIGLWARQTGKDFTCAAEAVVDCIQNPKTNWLIVAAGERQAIESLEKAKEWAERLKFDIKDYSISSATGLHRNASAEIKWANGSRIIALPAKPETIRGYSANVILTEFAFHENPEAIWRAIYPSISNPLRGGLKKLRIISTPNGLSNKFANLWLSTPNLNPNPPPRSSRREEAQIICENVELDPALVELATPSLPAPSSALHAPLYHKSKITIHDAVALGLPLDIDELRRGLGDDEAWRQEYLCDFTDNSTVLFPYDLIESCESPLATETSSVQSLSSSAHPSCPNAPQLYAGVDFARKNHLTVCWILERIPNPSINPNSAISNPHSFLTREVLTLKNLSTPEQLEILLPRLQRCQRICVDYTGPGIGFGDYLQKELGATAADISAFRKYTHKVWQHSASATRLDLCQFTPAFKAELFPRLRSALENRELLIPSSRDIREDLHSIYRTVTHTGQIQYRAYSTPDGHADRTTALALALRAVETAPVSRPSVARCVTPEKYFRDPSYIPTRTIAVLGGASRRGYMQLTTPNQHSLS